MGDTESIADLIADLSESFTRESYHKLVLTWSGSSEFAEKSTEIAFGENGLLNPDITEDQFAELIGQMGMEKSHAYSTKDIFDLLSGNILISPEIRKKYESQLHIYYMTILNYFLGCRDLERKKGGLIYALKLQEGSETPIKEYWAGCGYDVDDERTCDSATREDIIEIQRFVYTFFCKEEDEAAFIAALEQPWPTEGNGGGYSEDDAVPAHAPATAPAAPAASAPTAPAASAATAAASAPTARTTSAHRARLERATRMETRISQITRKLASPRMVCTGPESVPSHLHLRPDEDEVHRGVWGDGEADESATAMTDTGEPEPDVEEPEPDTGKLAGKDERQQIVMDTDRVQNIKRILEVRSELRKPLNEVADSQARAIAANNNMKHSEPGISLDEDQKILIDVNIKMTKVLEHSGVAQLLEDFQSEFFSSHGEGEKLRIAEAVPPEPTPEPTPAPAPAPVRAPTSSVLDTTLEVGEEDDVGLGGASKETGPANRSGGTRAKNGGGAKSRRKTKKKSRRKTKKKTRKTRRKSRNKIRKKYKNRKTQKGVYSRIKLSGGAQRGCAACDQGHCLKHRRGLPAQQQPAADARRVGNTGCMFLAVALQTVGRIIFWDIPVWIGRGVLGLLGWLVSMVRGPETGGDVNLGESVEAVAPGPDGSVEVEPPSPAPAPEPWIPWTLHEPEPERRVILSEPICKPRRKPPWKDKSHHCWLKLPEQVPQQWMQPPPPGSTVIFEKYPHRADSNGILRKSPIEPKNHVRYIYDDDHEKLAYWETLLNVPYHDRPQFPCVFPNGATVKAAGGVFPNDVILDPLGRRTGRGIKVLGVEMIENAPQWRQFLEKQRVCLGDVKSKGTTLVRNIYREAEGKKVPFRITTDFETIPEIVKKVNQPVGRIIDPQELTSCPSQKGADTRFMTTDDKESINMIDVWHGCDPLNIAAIKLNGFSKEKAADTGLYGPGAYFASQPCKALQYCSAIGTDGDAGAQFLRARVSAETKLREKSCPKPVLEQRDKWIKHCRADDYRSDQLPEDRVYKLGDAVLYLSRSSRGLTRESARIMEVQIRTIRGKQTYIYRIKFAQWNKTATFFSQTPRRGGDEVLAYHDELWPDIRIYCVVHSSVILGVTVPISGSLVGTNGWVPAKQCLTSKSAKYPSYDSVMAIGGVANGGTQIHHEFVSMEPEKFTYVSHVIWFTTN